MKKTPLARGLAVLAAAAMLLFASGCSDNGNTSEPGPSSTPAASPSASASATPSETPTATPTPAPAIGSIDEVSVEGEVGSSPLVNGPFPFSIAETASKVLNEGSGPVVNDITEVLELNYIGVNARTGTEFDSSFMRGKAAVFGLEQVVPGFQKGLVGKKLGDRVLIVMNSADGYDASGGNAQAGIELGDTLVFVVEILNKAFDEPTGESVAPADGLPTVAFADGKPTVTMPTTAPPTQVVTQTLIKGQGRAVTATDAVSVRYAMYNWADGTELYSTYGGNIETGALSGLIEGWREGLVGQTTGSRVLMVVPPAKAYPNGNGTPSIEKDATLVFVIDIAFAQPA